MLVDILDRGRKVANHLEPRHIETVAIGMAEGWCEEDIALGMLWRAIFHFRMLEGVALDLTDVEAEVRLLWEGAGTASKLGRPFDAERPPELQENAASAETQDPPCDGSP